MRIVWDEIKRQTNIKDHGLDFADLDVGFFERALVVETYSDRWIAFGEFRGLAIIAVVYKQLGTEGISVISMRPASMKERKLL